MPAADPSTALLAIRLRAAPLRMTTSSFPHDDNSLRREGIFTPGFRATNSRMMPLSRTIRGETRNASLYRCRFYRRQHMFGEVRMGGTQSTLTTSSTCSTEEPPLAGPLQQKFMICDCPEWDSRQYTRGSLQGCACCATTKCSLRNPGFVILSEAEGPAFSVVGKGPMNWWVSPKACQPQILRLRFSR
jgi:hypothetical protein